MLLYSNVCVRFSVIQIMVALRALERRRLDLFKFLKASSVLQTKARGSQVFNPFGGGHWSTIYHVLHHMIKVLK